MAKRSLMTLLCLVFLSAVTAWGQNRPDLVLRGEIKPDQLHTYVLVPLDVPGHVDRVMVVFHYTGRDQHAVLDLGVESPDGLRGWSGGNKDTFTIGESDATPSYFPGKVVPGRWNLLIGVSNIGKNSSQYDARIYFSHFPHDNPSSGFASSSLRSEEAWYRGDLHMHTGHSDGRCASQTGHEVPCPVFLTAEEASRRGLDFIAITDHNTTSQSESLRELQPYFDRLLFIPGREVTTFQGHLNVLGTTQPLDFRVGTADVPDMNTLLRAAHRAGALVSINHPNAPTGEACMGCGWKPKPDADLTLVDAIEAVNGGAEGTSYDGLPFWEAQLNRGLRPTAIGGSDNHRPETSLDKPGSVGSPTTVVRATELSPAAIMEGIRHGHVFVDLSGSKDRVLDFMASTATQSASMGDAIPVANDASVDLKVHVTHCEGASVRMTFDGHPLGSAPVKTISLADETIPFILKSDGARHWVRADVISIDGKLMLLGNPIYLDYPSNYSNVKYGEVTKGQ